MAETGLARESKKNKRTKCTGNLQNLGTSILDSLAIFINESIQ